MKILKERVFQRKSVVKSCRSWTCSTSYHALFHILSCTFIILALMLVVSIIICSSTYFMCIWWSMSSWSHTFSFTKDGMMTLVMIFTNSSPSSRHLNTLLFKWRMMKHSLPVLDQRLILRKPLVNICFRMSLMICNYLKSRGKFFMVWSQYNLWESQSQIRMCSDWVDHFSNWTA